MILRFNVHTRNRLCALGLLIGLIGLTAPTAAQSQPTSSIRDTLSPFVHSFNRLSTELSEMRFEYSAIDDERIQNWRAMACGELMEIYNVSGEVQQIININMARQIPMIARNGDTFTTFLNQEKQLLTNSERLGELRFSDDSWEIVLRQAIQFRLQIATSTPHQVVNTISEISIERLREGTVLLCDDAHSPARNESTAGWKTWLWHGLEVIGGTAVFLGNLLVNPEPNTKAMSMYLGTLVAGNGYSGLSALLRSSQ